jgi:hypothetical protein
MKRSTQVALLLMGVTGVGASAYAMAPGKRDCVPPNQQPPAASAAAAISGKDGKNPEPCPTRRSYHSSGSGYYRSSYYSSSPSHWSTPIFARKSGATQTQAGRPPAGSATSLGFSGGSSTSTSTSTARSSSTSTSTSSSTSRGGFGSTGSSVASHSSSS